MSPEHECVHDWRLDPFAPVLMTYPPIRAVVCARCGASSLKRDSLPSAVPADWPKA